MKTQILALVVVAALCGAQTVNASIVNDYIVLSLGNGAVQYGDGGEFQVSVYAHLADVNVTSPVATFYTFCADTQHYFYPGNTYHVTGEVQDNSSLGSFGSWLYYNYWNNSDQTAPNDLNGYVPGHAVLSNTSSFGTSPNQLTSQQVAGAIQAEIWTALGKPIPDGYGYQDVKTTAEEIFGWNPKGNYGSVGEVDVLTLTPLTSGGVDDPAQGQLYVPGFGAGPPTPEPTTFVIWGLLGLVAAGYGTWRRKQVV